MEKSFFLRLAFLAALVGMLGSLFFSDFAGFPPCLLCWYQRIAMYPLVFIFGAALWSNDEGYLKYSLPLSVVGLLTAVYHNLLYFGIISEALAPCKAGASCTTKQVELLGFLTIPLMSLIGFVIIVGLQLAAHSQRKRR